MYTILCIAFQRINKNVRQILRFVGMSLMRSGRQVNVYAVSWLLVKYYKVNRVFQVLSSSRGLARNIEYTGV